ncbi:MULTISPECIES: lysophospholipid acyltransferase family protein [Acinetobacter calcoaceticus/baumannii complex]|uniref:Lipid A biosynthesis acyltransferase n=1 Tax=Acinetobacter nosocomialis TaxID=106654 RepID=A0AB37CX74_ACINO|nr:MULTISPECIES: lysophospholipid acyltransferase family protein [Acinetobacter calcoaceticus/baumannii complex]MBR7738490.1 lysophospholipid acyltransferase family protein [Acinetobacter nosocomialis]MBR7749124.1 lysophospholipid acyltransferase family protein [Acinetobacter nosocomialis]MDE1667480.1 lysophospholipid acyltransferase family protein [Acinetobacter nosocomialis]MDE9417065.1 lysophospholipid acyltransferase family protein [Acinetobacter nosocomialis]MDO7436390.1 lysophospholipid 
MTRPDSKSMNYQLLKTFSRLPIQFGRSIARLLAGLVNTLKITKTSKSIELNLRIALPHLTPQQRIAITEKAVHNELTSYFEFLSIWGSSNEENIARIHRIEGEQYFHDALAAKKGVVLIVPHFGTWEVMNAWCAQFTAMTILYKPVKDDDADRFVREARSREQANLVPTDETGVRQIFKALKQGETTVILPDHTPNIGGDMVNYFGVPLASSNLSAKLIQKTKAKALFLYAIRNENDGFTMHIEPMDEKIYEGTADDGTYVIHQAIEQLIHKYPEHYHWSYKRFKANPALDNVYNIDPSEAIKTVNRLKAEALGNSTQPEALKTSVV